VYASVNPVLASGASVVTSAILKIHTLATTGTSLGTTGFTRQEIKIAFHKLSHGFSKGIPVRTCQHTDHAEIYLKKNVLIKTVTFHDGYKCNKSCTFMHRIGGGKKTIPIFLFFNKKKGLIKEEHFFSANIPTRWTSGK
jgi:hypothetical protein